MLDMCWSIVGARALYHCLYESFDCVTKVIEWYTKVLSICAQWNEWRFWLSQSAPLVRPPLPTDLLAPSILAKCLYCYIALLPTSKLTTFT